MVCAYSIMMMKLNVVIESRVWRTIPPTSTERTSPFCFCHTPARYCGMEGLLDFDFDGLTPDQLEMIATDIEASISVARLVQTRVVRAIDRQQVPLGDGVRTLEEWLVGRLDVKPATARSLAVVARRGSSILDEALADGVGFDRVSEVAASSGT